MPYVIIAVCFGLAGGIVGRTKGSSFVLWFLISGALPFVGLLAALAYRREVDELRRQCPTRSVRAAAPSWSSPTWRSLRSPRRHDRGRRRPDRAPSRKPSIVA
jgi:hypothetical protein